jgi:hypothetical protein
MTSNDCRGLFALRRQAQRTRSIQLADGVRENRVGGTVLFSPALNANTQRCHLAACANPELRGPQPAHGCESACIHRGGLRLSDLLASHKAQNH